MTNEIEISERGWPAHYMLASACTFRRNTLITCGRVRVVVSTVGNLRNKGHKAIPINGLNGFYETKVFKAIWEAPYWEADTPNEYGHFKSKCRVDHCRHEADNEANEMHNAVVQEFVEYMRDGIDLSVLKERDY